MKQTGDPWDLGSRTSLWPLGILYEINTFVNYGQSYAQALGDGFVLEWANWLTD